ncbi:hypothetical protein FNYG_15021 [Fusarium nygamai]|uniref:Uncharacterized protein n=1 Tax=Gibberella nygamai TaxID=42673 RepID=A0A2K0ULZ0_GIBNY|nr:hypothetical protein FNYG_15021 [Fusarium nygamai]
MAHANRAIIANPRPNRLEVLNSTEIRKTERAPPPLDYRNVTSKSLNARDSGNGTSKDLRYSVPEELIKAARLLSENWKPSTNDLDGGYVADYDSGLIKPVLEPPSAFRYSENYTDVPEYVVDKVKNLYKRASSDWWMATISQRGSSPFAPSGYQVWRDVKDFGAKGKWILT